RSSPNVRSAAMARKPRTNSGTIGGRLALTGAASVFVDTVPEEGSSGEPAPPSMLAAVLASAPASALASAPDPAPDPAPASAVVDCTFARHFPPPPRTAYLRTATLGGGRVPRRTWTGRPAPGRAGPMMRRPG